MFAYLSQKIRGRNIILLFLVFAFVFVSFGILVLPKGVAAEKEPLPVCEPKPKSVGSSIFSRILGVISFLGPTGGLFGSTEFLPKQIDQYYECTGYIPSVAIQMDRTVECIVACSDAKGFVFEYTDREGNPLFCSGAIEEATCEIKDSQGTPLTLNLNTGNKDIACDKLNFGCWLKGLLNLVAGILDVFVGGLALLIKAIAVTLASVMSKVINYAVSVPVSPSSDQAPEFVKDIWNFSRALANSFFLLILAIIGLTTILRVQSYQWQKTLPSLIIAVLLINFSGVLVGFVVDMANIVTTTLLQEAGDTSWKIPSIMGVETLALHVGEIVFYFFLAFAYFATMLLFVLRTVALWIIAAIGPLAFALYVLPVTKSYWEQWFKALFQWAIMGIPASFALFFASKAMQLTEASIKGTGNPPAFFAQAVGPFTAAVILIVGMGMALAGAPAVSQGVMNFGRKSMTNMGKKVGLATKKNVAAFARQKLVESERMQGLAKKMATAATPGTGKPGLFARVQRAATKPLWGTSRALGRTLGPGAVDAQKAEIGAAEKSVDKATVATVVSKFRGANALEKVGYINRLIKQNDLDEAISKYGLTFTEIEETRSNAERYEEHKDIVSALPHRESARMDALVTAGRYPSRMAAYRAEVIGKIRPDRAKQVSETALSDAEIVELMVRYWDGRHIAKLVEQHGTKAVQALQNRITALAAPTGLSAGDWLKDHAHGNNEALHKYLTTTPGQALGFTIA